MVSNFFQQIIQQLHNDPHRRLQRQGSLVYSHNPFHSHSVQDGNREGCGGCRQCTFLVVPPGSSVPDITSEKVNKKVGKGLASAIETGESAVQKTSEVPGKTKEKASEVSNVAAQKTNQACYCLSLLNEARCSLVSCRLLPERRKQRMTSRRMLKSNIMPFALIRTCIRYLECRCQHNNLKMEFSMTLAYSYSNIGGVRLT